MAQTIKLKRSSVSGNTPGTSDLELGEVAINTYDGKMFIKKNDGSDSIVEIGGTSGTVTEAFKTISVSGQNNVVADSATDTLTLVAGSNMTLTTNASGDTITFASSGVPGSQNVFTTFAVSGQNSVVADSTTDTLTLVAGSGITLTTDNSNDEITITNSATGANAFGNIAISGQTTVAADSTNDTLTLTAGTGITLTTDATNDGITITNSATGANAFGNIAVSGQSTVAADTTNDTVSFVAGSNMTITTNASGDTVTFASSGGGGSQNVFSNIAVSGQGTVQADATTDTLTVVAGTGISLTTDTSADSLTITNTGSVNVANAASTIKEFKYDISSSTTTITGSDANSNTLAYEAGALQVFLNGILLDPATDYTASNGTSVVLTDAAVNGDDVQIVAFNRKIVTANVGLSTFTGDGTTTAFTLSSDPVNENNTRVHIDGVYQEKAAYSVSGTTLTFSGAPPNGSSIEVEIGFTQAEIGSTLDFADNAILRLGTGNDLQILHDGSDSIIKDTGTGDLQIAASTLEVKNSGLSETMIKAIQDGAVELYHDNNKKLETVTGGVTITGTVTATTFSGDLSGTINTATTGATQSASDNSTKLATTAYVTTALSNLVDSAPGTLNTLNELAAALGDDANFSTTITNSLATKVGLTATTGAANMPAGTTAQRPGSPAAGQFRYNSTLSQFEGYTSSWGAIGGGGTNTFTTDTLTTSGSATVTLSQAVSSPNDCIVHIDGIYQTPTDAYTVSGTTLTFTATPASGRKVVVYSVKAGVSGNNLNTQTFSGNGSATSFTMNVNPINENNTIVHIDGVYQQKTSYSTSGTTLAFSAAPANGTTIEVATFTQTEINVPVNDTIDTVHIKDDAVTSAKLGGNLTMPGNISFADNGKAIFGASSNLEIYYDGNHSYIKESTSGNLKIGGTNLHLMNGALTEYYFAANENGAAYLYYDNAQKLETASGGVTVTGTLTATTLAGTLSTAAQTNITSVGTLTGLTSSGQIKSQSDFVLADSGGTNRGFVFGTASGVFARFNNGLSFQVQEAGSTKFTIASGGNATFTNDLTVDTDTLHVDSSNSRVGIGLTSGMSSILTVNNEISLGPDANNRGIINYSSNTLSLGTRQSSSNYFSTVNVTSGKVGIGTNSPATLLTLNGNNPSITFENGESPHWELGFENTNSDRFVLYDNNASSYRLIIDSSGNATFAGTVVLPVGSASAPSLTFSGDTNTGIYRTTADQLGFAAAGANQATFLSNRYMFGTSVSGVYYNASSAYTPTMLLKSSHSGELATLAIINGDNAYGGAIDFVHITTNNSTQQRFASIVGVSDNRVSTSGAGHLSFRTMTGAGNVVEHMRIASGGNVGIGDAPSSFTNAALHVAKDMGSSVTAVARLRGRNTTARTTRLQFEDYGGAIADGLIDFHFPNAGSHTGAYLGMGYNAGNQLVINSSGNVGIGNQSPTQARLVAQTASGMSIAAIKDNTGASMSFGGVTQPRVLLEAGPSSNQFKLYTATGSSYASAGWQENLRIDNSASSGHLQMGAFGVTGLNTVAALHGAGNDATLVLTNGALAGSNSSYGWQGRGSRVLTSNGTNWQTDGRDPAIVVGSATASDDRGQGLGIILHNETNTSGHYGPIVGWSTKSPSNSYNSMYAYIVGKKTGTGVDANWSAGELQFDTAGLKPNGSNQYMTDTPAMSIIESGAVIKPHQPHIRLYGNSSSRVTHQGTTVTAFTNFSAASARGITFNSGNGLITLPIAGTYLVQYSFYLWMDNVGHAVSHSVVLYRNSTSQQESIMEQPDHTPGGSYVFDNTLSNSLILDCSTGDTLRFQCYADIYGGSVHTNASVYLLG